jgi:hypothetical protein
MKHESSVRYPAPIDVVIRMFTDRDFHVRKLDRLASGSYEVLDHENDGQHFRIRIERRVPVQMPGLMKKAAPSETRVVNEEHWDIASRTGRVLVEPQGMPVEMSCETRMQEENGSCVVSYSWNVKAKIPVMGGTLEKFIVSDMDKRAAEEAEVAIGLLENYR